MATMTIRCPEELKEEASKVANYYGLDLSTATRCFWKQMTRTRSIPLDLRPSEEPNEESLKAIAETEEIFANGGPTETYDSVEEFMKAVRS